MSILYSTIRTLIIDKVINAFFNNVVTAFSRFDVFNNIRFFEEIHIEDSQDSLNIYYDCHIIIIVLQKNNRINFVFTCTTVCTPMGITTRPLFHRVVSNSNITFISDKILKVRKVKKVN